MVEFTVKDEVLLSGIIALLTTCEGTGSGSGREKQKRAQMICLTSLGLPFSLPVVVATSSLEASPHPPSLFVISLPTTRQ